MKIGIELSDFKIHSDRVFRITLFSLSVVLVTILMVEFLWDLDSTSIGLLIPLNIMSLTLISLFYFFPNSGWVRLGLVALVYCIVESHFVVNPKSLHVIAYWLPIIPITALIVAGIRTSVAWGVIVFFTSIGNFFYASSLEMAVYTVEISAIKFVISGTIFLLSILASCFLLYVLLGNAYGEMKANNHELTQLRLQIEAKKNRIEQFQQSLIRISRDELLQGHQQVNLFKGICKTAVETLPVSRVSIWFLSEDNTKLSRAFLYEQAGSTDELVTLRREHYPNYFQALETKPFIMATHAWEHPDTREFANTYLRALNIHSMLDCPIYENMRCVGVVCCENQLEEKAWSIEDTLFVQSLADFVSITHMNEKIRSLLREVHHSNAQLNQRNSEILSMNDELKSLNEELNSVNERLEETVQERTKTLEQRNVQLTEYAFINSHLLRAPLTRVMGLSSLVTKEVKTVQEQQLLDALTASAQELDTIIRKIADMLYQGHHFTREDVRSIIDKNLKATVRQVDTL